MFEFVCFIGEVLSGYIAGRNAESKRSSFHLSAVISALSCGLIFFSVYGIYELIFPAPNPMGNVWLGLLLLSLGFALLSYLLLLVAHWIEGRQRRKDEYK